MSSSLPMVSVVILGCWPLVSDRPGPAVPGADPNPPQWAAWAPAHDPRQQRADRERAVAAVGPAARSFVETYGEEGVAALLVCQQPVALALVELHNSGRLGQLPRPRGLLQAIVKTNQGNDVAAWAVAHVDELEDADTFYAFVQDPLPYALALKNPAEGARQVRDNRLRFQAQRTEQETLARVQLVGIGIGAVALGALVIWRIRKRRVEQGF